jgi:hypothetical protein
VAGNGPDGPRKALSWSVSTVSLNGSQWSFLPAPEVLDGQISGPGRQLMPFTKMPMKISAQKIRALL